MFSELDRELGAETLEYAWLMELTCGNLLGKVTIPQIYNLVMGLETLVYLTADKELRTNFLMIIFNYHNIQ